MTTLRGTVSLCWTFPKNNHHFVVLLESNAHSKLRVLRFVVDVVSFFTFVYDVEGGALQRIKHWCLWKPVVERVQSFSPCFLGNYGVVGFNAHNYNIQLLVCYTIMATL